MAPRQRPNGRKHPADNGSKWLKPNKRESIYQRDGYHCVYCGMGYEQLFSPSSHLTLDHLVPHELGGTNEARNLVTACRTCNSSRGSKNLKDFLKYLEEKKGIDPEVVRNRIKLAVRRKLRNFKERLNGKTNRGD